MTRRADGETSTVPLRKRHWAFSPNRRSVIFFAVGLAIVAVAAGRWACDGTIRDQQQIDQLVRDATWWFPDATRPTLQQLHASQTRTGRMGERQEHLYVRFTRPNEFEPFISRVTSKLEEADAKQPGRWRWTLQRDVEMSEKAPTAEAPRWWPCAERADVVLELHDGATLIAPAGSDSIFIWYFVP